MLVHNAALPKSRLNYYRGQDCQELMDRKNGGGCRFQSNVKGKLASHHSLRANLGHSEAWDLEDLVKAGLDKTRVLKKINLAQWSFLGFFVFF
jgi:hypothetical protein